MRKIIIAIILFTSCQVQENKPVPKPANKITETPAKINNTARTPAAIQSQENNIAIEENNEQPETAANKHSQVKNAASTIITTDTQVECAEPNKAPNTGVKEAKDNNGGASSYEEGYIPFIKQYW